MCFPFNSVKEKGLMKFYTDVSIHKNKILLRGYENNKRIKKIIDYKPYLFQKTKEQTEYKTIYGEPLKRLDFENITHARQALKASKSIANKTYYGFEKFQYSFISDEYKGNIQYDVNQIKIMYLDIEASTEGGNPDIETANKHITAISFKIGNTRTALGLKPFDINKVTFIKDKQNIHYYQFKSEKELLMSFVQLWEAADIDVLTDWNGALFDLPYIVRRIRIVLGNSWAKRLSPWGILKEKLINVRGKDYIVYLPLGIQHLDYMDLYKKFTYSQRESYSLNYIAHTELGTKKLDYSAYENLSGLYNNNHQLFLEYNLTDVDLVQQLEDKLKLIELVYAMAYDAKVNYIDTLGSVLIWDVLIMNYLKEKNIAVSPKVRVQEREFEGAYVKDPQIGMHRWVVSCDLQSLYPFIIQQNNISPETFIKKINLRSYYNTNGNPIDKMLETKEFPIIENGVVCANGCVFNNTSFGFLPALMRQQFALRNDYKEKMKEAKKKSLETNNPEDEKEVTRWHNAQLAKKIFLNSCYGAQSNIAFRWYNPDFAEAITLTGQLIIRYIAKETNLYIQSLLKSNKDFVIAMDTDSMILSFEDVINHIKPKNPVDFLDKLAKEKIEPLLKDRFDKLAKLTNAKENLLYMKREFIADVAIWRAKKNYVANVLDNEGIRYKEPELKIMGIEVVRSSTPEICRGKLKEAIKLLVTKDENSIQEFIQEFKKEYYNLPFEDIAFPRSVKNLTKYYDRDEIYKIRTPIHVKGSLLYNNLLSQYDLKNKYSEIYNSDKIKFAYLKEPNPLRDSVIAVPTILPKEFELDQYIDYKTMFEKSFLEPIKSLLDVIGWKHEKTNNLKGLFKTKQGKLNE